MKSIDRQINELELLQGNWNSYKADSPSAVCISALRKILLSPTVDGGVYVRLGGWDIEIASDGKLEAMSAVEVGAIH